MRPPGFWSNPAKAPGFAAALLAPIALLWKAATARRLRNGPWHRVSVPVICVGNINLGGTGKTPTVIALCSRLQDMGRNPHVVSRGYGGSETGPTKVNERDHEAAQVGDEPLLLAAFCHTWVSKDRHKGALAAIDDGADVIVLDDGLQNPALAKDLSIVVVDSARGFGNGCVVPSGPLREPLEKGLERAQLVLSIGSQSKQAAFQETWGRHINKPLVQGALTPLETGMDWKDQRVLAFAGIGHPEKFFATLKGLGAEIVRAEALADHQPLTDRFMHRLNAEAMQKGAQLVTTEKDAARLSPEFRNMVVTLPVRLEIRDWAAIDAELNKIGIN